MTAQLEGMVALLTGATSGIGRATALAFAREGANVVRAIDRAYLYEQHGTEERLRIRIEAHQRYSERADDYLDWILDRLQPRPGDLVVDVGCGVGSIHPPLCARGVRPFWAGTCPGRWWTPVNARRTNAAYQ